MFKPIASSRVTPPEADAARLPIYPRRDLEMPAKRPSRSTASRTTRTVANQNTARSASEVPASFSELQEVAHRRRKPDLADYEFGKSCPPMR